MSKIRTIVCAGILLLVLLPGPVRAQYPWSFQSLEEACLGDAYFVTPPAELRHAVDRAAGQPVLYNVSYHISGPYRSWGRDYVRFQQIFNQWPQITGTDFRLPAELASQLMPYLVSHLYWQQRFGRLVQWVFVDTGQLTGMLCADSASHIYGRYTTFAWLGYHFQPSEEAPVVFSVSVGGGGPQSLTLRALERLAEWGAFATHKDFLGYQAHNAGVERSRQEHEEALQRQIDSLSRIILSVERQADSMTVAIQNDSAAWVRAQSKAEVERTKVRMDRNEIFLMSVQPARNNHMFGLELNFYNCYPRTISKIEIEITPYNDRTRVQQDHFGRSVRTVRCMGPVRPGAPAQYTFDELFWSEKNEIKFMRVTGLTFHFTDGTTRSFYGHENILRHTLNH